MNWEHVTAPHSRIALMSNHIPSHIDLCRVLQEMSECYAMDATNEDIPYRVLDVRARAIRDMADIMSSDNDVYDADGNYSGNLGVDKLAAMSCVRRFWSDGEIS